MMHELDKANDICHTYVQILDQFKEVVCRLAHVESLLGQEHIGISDVKADIIIRELGEIHDLFDKMTRKKREPQLESATTAP